MYHPNEFDTMIRRAREVAANPESGSRGDRGPDWLWIRPEKPGGVGQTAERRVRLLPPHPAQAPEFWFQSAVHRLTFDGQIRTKACLDVHGQGEKCPACARQAEYWRGGGGGAPAGEE